MEILIVITTACMCGILWCLLQFEKRTRILQDQNEALAERVEALEDEWAALIESKRNSEKFKRMMELSRSFGEIGGVSK